MANFYMQSERIGFRLMTESDIEYLEPLECDPDVKKYFPPHPRDRASVMNTIKRFMNNYETQKLPCFMLFELRQPTAFIGRAGFGPTETGEIEVGYVLHKKYWGAGYATEALNKLLAWARENLTVSEIIAFAEKDNIGSTRVMEKCGMTYFKNDFAKGMECRFYKIKNQ